MNLQRREGALPQSRVREGTRPQPLGSPFRGPPPPHLRSAPPSCSRDARPACQLLSRTAALCQGLHCRSARFLHLLGLREQHYAAVAAQPPWLCCIRGNLDLQSALGTELVCPEWTYSTLWDAEPGPRNKKDHEHDLKKKNPALKKPCFLWRDGRWQLKWSLPPEEARLRGGRHTGSAQF